MVSFTKEATGVYYESLAYFLFEKKHAVHVLLPNKAKKFAESLNIKSKTDKIDSKILGRMGVERVLEKWVLSSKIYRRLRVVQRKAAIGQRKEQGKWKGKARISKKGNSHIRQIMYMPSLSAIQYSETYKSFYERLNEKKQNGLISGTAVQRKLLGLIYTLWKNDSEYIGNYEMKSIS